MTHFQIVLSTCTDREQAERIAHRLVEQRLAACVNILPGVQSIYRWQDGVEAASEVLMLIKTSAAHTAEVPSPACIPTKFPNSWYFPSAAVQRLILPGWRRV